MIDLHIHTTNSDGRLKEEEILERNGICMEERYKSKIVVDLLLKRKNENGKEEILLLLRENTGYLDGYYDLPSGHVEKDEDLFAAMIREAKEEIGIDIFREDMKIVHIYHNFRNGMLKFGFSAYIYEGRLINNDPEKCKELKWFETENLPENIIPRIREEILNVENDVFYSYDVKISKATKKRENPSKNTKTTIEQKQKMIYNSLSKERENANNKTNKWGI